jgi:hypothetical protein
LNFDNYGTGDFFEENTEKVMSGVDSPDFTHNKDLANFCGGRPSNGKEAYNTSESRTTSDDCVLFKQFSE